MVCASDFFGNLFGDIVGPVWYFLIFSCVCAAFCLFLFVFIYFLFGRSFWDCLSVWPSIFGNFGGGALRLTWLTRSRWEDDERVMRARWERLVVAVHIFPISDKFVWPLRVTVWLCGARVCYLRRCLCGNVFAQVSFVTWLVFCFFVLWSWVFVVKRVLAPKPKPTPILPCILSACFRSKSWLVFFRECLCGNWPRVLWERFESVLLWLCIFLLLDKFIWPLWVVAWLCGGRACRLRRHLSATFFCDLTCLFLVRFVVLGVSSEERDCPWP